MTKSSEQKLEFQRKYNAEPAQIKAREAENLARQHALKAGRVKKGDGKDVDHVKPLANGGSAKDSNTRVVSEKTNRGWRKGESGYNPGAQKK